MAAEIRFELDYEDWRECLGRWMMELHEPTGDWLTFADWEYVYHALEFDAAAARESCEQCRLTPARHFVRGVTTSAEFSKQLNFSQPLWHQVWSGAAAHRAGVDWMGHLLLAGSRGCPEVLNSVVRTYYLRLRGEVLLAAESWSRHEDDVPSEFGDGWQYRRIIADDQIRSMGWDGSSYVQTVDAAADLPEDAGLNSEAPYSHDLDWIGWQGASLRDQVVTDAAWQSAMIRGAPLVAKLQGYVNYLVLRPDLSTSAVIEATDLIDGNHYTMRPSFTSPTGWRITPRFWDQRN